MRLFDCSSVCRIVLGWVFVGSCRVVVYASAPVYGMYGVYGCSNVGCTSVCSLQVCRQPMCLCDLFSSAYVIKSSQIYT